MALSNSQYDAIMREYGKQQMEAVRIQFGRQKRVNGLVVSRCQHGQRPAQSHQLYICRMKLRFPLL